MEQADSELFAEIESLDDLILSANQALQAAVLHESNRAFNLGLRTWLIPGSLLIIAIFAFSRANWAMTGITAALVVLGIVVFVLFVASRSKAKSPARIYNEDLSKIVRNKLNLMGETYEGFTRRSLEFLPEEALLAQTLRQHENGSDMDHLLHEE